MAIINDRCFPELHLWTSRFPSTCHRWKYGRCVFPHDSFREAPTDTTPGLKGCSWCVKPENSLPMFLQATNAESQAPEIGLRLRNQWQNGCRWDSRILTSKSSFLTYYNRKHAFLSRHLRRRGALERAQESSARWVIGTRLLIHLSHNHRWETLAEIYYIYLSQVCGTFLELTPQRMGQVTID